MTEVHNSVPVATLIGIGSVFLTMIVLAIIVVRRKWLQNTVKVNIMSKSGHRTSKRIKRKNLSDTFSVGDETYFYDEKATISTRFGKEIYYAKGHTKPLQFTVRGFKSGEISAKNFKAIIETTLINKLFNKEIVTFDNILIIIALILSGIAVFLLFMMKSQGVELADTPQNVELMRSMIKQALATGV